MLMLSHHQSMSFGPIVRNARRKACQSTKGSTIKFATNSSGLSPPYSHLSSLEIAGRFVRTSVDPETLRSAKRGQPQKVP